MNMIFVLLTFNSWIGNLHILMMKTTKKKSGDRYLSLHTKFVDQKVHHSIGLILINRVRVYDACVS